jgi:small subunit ribosomal protein S16
VVRIRLARRGKNKKPTYRIVVTDARSPRDGRFIEIIGNYNPVQQPKVLNIDADRARYWLSVGAQPSDTVAYLLKQQGVDPKPGTPYAPAQQTEQPSAQPVLVQPAIVDRPTDATA